MRNDLIEIVRKEVMENIIKKGGGEGGDDLHKIKLSVMDIRDVLYKTLRDIEIKEVDRKWGM